jgi:hypothetical protein
LLERPSAKRAGELCNSSRNQLRIMMGLLTGHCYLKGHVFIMGLIESPACDRHNYASEMASHIFCDYEAMTGTGSIRIQAPGPLFLETG